MPDSQFPVYLMPNAVYADLVFAALTGQRRRFKAHADRMVGGIQPPLQVLGAEYIPRDGPGVITVNHYSRPGFWTPWFPAAISAAVPAEIYWTMTSAWRYPGQRWGRLYRWLSSQVLARVARVYGFNSMPPMPPAPDEIGQRAAAVTRLMRYARANPRALIGLAPEGGDQPGGVLGCRPAGLDGWRWRWRAGACRFTRWGRMRRRAAFICALAHPTGWKVGRRMGGRSPILWAGSRDACRSGCGEGFGKIRFRLAFGFCAPRFPELKASPTLARAKKTKPGEIPSLFGCVSLASPTL